MNRTLLVATALTALLVASQTSTAEAGMMKHCRDTSFFAPIFKSCKKFGTEPANSAPTSGKTLVRTK